MKIFGTRNQCMVAENIKTFLQFNFLLSLYILNPLWTFLLVKIAIWLKCVIRHITETIVIDQNFFSQIYHQNVIGSKFVWGYFRSIGLTELKECFHCPIYVQVSSHGSHGWSCKIQIRMYQAWNMKNLVILWEWWSRAIKYLLDDH